MRRELEEKIIKDFPELCSDRELPSSFYFGFEHGDGWFDIVYNLCKQISEISPETKIAQVKEKYGVLSFYIYNGTEEVYNLIEEVELKSTSICEWCGKEGRRYVDYGWYRTLCSDCHNELLKERGAKNE